MSKQNRLMSLKVEGDPSITIIATDAGYWKILLFYSYKGKLLESWWSDAYKYDELVKYNNSLKIRKVEKSKDRVTLFLHGGNTLNLKSKM